MVAASKRWLLASLATLATVPMLCSGESGGDTQKQGLDLDRLDPKSKEIIKNVTEYVRNRGDVKIIDIAKANSLTGASGLKNVLDFKSPGKSFAVGEGGRVALNELPAIERIIGQVGAPTNFLPIAFLEKGVAVQKAVARVTLTEQYGDLLAGEGWGTGFMVSESILITNNHVIPDKNFAKKLEAQFNAQTDLRGRLLPIDYFSFDEDSYFYTNEELDFTLIRLKPTDRSAGGSPLPQGSNGQAGSIWGRLLLRDSLQVAEGQPVNIIQHPRGRPKEVALQDNVIDKQGIFEKVIWYTTDTEVGSSGSPVMNNSWEVIALHHAGGKKQGEQFLNNEGIRIDRIVAHLRQNLKSDTKGVQVLAELGL